MCTTHLAETETPEASDQLADNARSAMPRMPSLDGSSSDLTMANYIFNYEEWLILANYIFSMANYGSNMFQ